MLVNSRTQQDGTIMFEPPQHVIDAYKEPHRKYHNLDHIQSILDKIPLFVEAYELNSEQSLWLEIIAWYHDVIYIPGPQQPSNEYLSAGKFKSDRWAGLIPLIYDNIPNYYEYVVQEIWDVIFGTRHHKSPPSFIGAIFFDLDLADMGTDSYIENSFKIREEFGEFSDLEWLAGRQKFLGDFLERPLIYHTSLGYKLWEEKARRNMENELHFLKGKYGF